MGALHDSKHFFVDTGKGNLKSGAPHAVHDEGEHFFAGRIHVVDAVGDYQDVAKLGHDTDALADLLLEVPGVCVEKRPVEAHHGDVPAFLEAEVASALERAVRVHGKGGDLRAHALVEKHAHGKQHAYHDPLVEMRRRDKCRNEG